MAAKIANANANEIVLSSALPNGLLPVRNTVSGTEPAPMNTRIAVPMASATSFCDNVGDDMRLPPRVLGPPVGSLPTARDQASTDAAT